MTTQAYEDQISAAIKAIMLELGNDITNHPNATAKEVASKMYNTQIDNELAKADPALYKITQHLTACMAEEFSKKPMDEFLTLMAAIEKLSGIKDFVNMSIKTYTLKHAKQLSKK